MGFGKCVIALTAAQELLRDGHVTRVLVLAPLSVCELTWRVEPDEWDHLDVRVTVATGTAAQRARAMEDPGPVVVTNFENIKWMMARYGDTFDGLIIDEITKVKSAGGAGVRALRHRVKKMAWRVGMTGTPVAESGEDLYAQCLLLDLGKALGTRKESFMRNYLVSTDYQQRNWVLMPGAAGRLADALSGLAYVADDAAYIDALPPVIDVDVPCVASERVYGYYRTMASKSVIEVDGEHVVAANSAVRQGKLEQLANGFVYPSERDTGGALICEPRHKLEKLLEIVEELQADREPVLIIYRWKYELEWLRTVFPTAPVLGDGSRVTPETIAAWNRREIGAMLGHPRSMSHGLNIAAGSSNIIHLAPLWSADQWAQCLGRLRRRGQTADKVTRWVLATRDTLEHDLMLQRMDAKGERERAIMERLGQG